MRLICSMLVLAVLSISGGSTHGLAQGNPQVCVSCINPSATYRCEVIPPETGAMVQSPQIFCASEVARTNGHKTCIIQRNMAGSRCDGEPVLLAYTGPIAEETETSGETATLEPGSSQPPKTLIEATDQAVQATGKQIKKAGKAVGTATKMTGDKIKETGQAVGGTVGDAAKSTWECIASLFQSC